MNTIFITSFILLILSGVNSFSQQIILFENEDLIVKKEKLINDTEISLELKRSNDTISIMDHVYRGANMSKKDSCGKSTIVVCGILNNNSNHFPSRNTCFSNLKIDYEIQGNFISQINLYLGKERIKYVVDFFNDYSISSCEKYKMDSVQTTKSVYQETLIFEVNKYLEIVTIGRVSEPWYPENEWVYFYPNGEVKYKVLYSNGKIDRIDMFNEQKKLIKTISSDENHNEIEEHHLKYYFNN